MFKGLTPSRETRLEITDRVLGEMAQVPREEALGRGTPEGVGKDWGRDR